MPASTCGTLQIAARHADPRTTMRYDRARENLDRYPNYILAAYIASGPDYIARSCLRVQAVNATPRLVLVMVS
jgi:hypothetical protein